MFTVGYERLGQDVVLKNAWTGASSVAGQRNHMNGYFLLMQFEKLDMSSFIFFGNTGEIASRKQLNSNRDDNGRFRRLLFG